MDAFLKQNVTVPNQVGYVASNKFKDSEGKLIPWKIKILETKEFNKIMSKNTPTKIIDKNGNNKGKMTEIEQGFAVMETLIERCVVYPNLNDSALQDSWGVIGAVELAQKMLTPGEFTDLASAIQQAHGFDSGTQCDLIEETKN